MKEREEAGAEEAVRLSMGEDQAATEEMREDQKQAPAAQASGWSYIGRGVLYGTCLGVAGVVATPLVLGAVSTGVVAGSIAASMQGSAVVAGIAASMQGLLNKELLKRSINT